MLVMTAEERENENKMALNYFTGIYKIMEIIIMIMIMIIIIIIIINNNNYYYYYCPFKIHKCLIHYTHAITLVALFTCDQPRCG